jgi:hypothetical protein
MNKTITLNKKDWDTIITGLSYAFEQALEVAETMPEWQDDADAYNEVLDLLTEKLAK